MCVFKDVFDYSLEEIAELVDSTIGGVKAGLIAADAKLASLNEQPATPRWSTPQNKDILRLYIERFDRQDSDGLRKLMAPDARLLVPNRYTGSFADRGYLGVYSRMRVTWRLALGEVDSKPAMVRAGRDKAWEIAGVVAARSGVDPPMQRIAVPGIVLGLAPGSIIGAGSVRDSATR